MAHIRSKTLETTGQSPEMGISEMISELPIDIQRRATRLARLYKATHQKLHLQSFIKQRSWDRLNMPDAFLRENGDIKTQRRLTRIRRNIRALDPKYGPKILEKLRSQS